MSCNRARRLVRDGGCHGWPESGGAPLPPCGQKHANHFFPPTKMKEKKKISQKWPIMTHWWSPTCIFWFTGWTISPMSFGSQKQDLPAGTKTQGRNITIKQTALSGFVWPSYYLFFPVDLWKQNKHTHSLAQTHQLQNRRHKKKKKTEKKAQSTHLRINSKGTKTPSAPFRENMQSHPPVDNYHILLLTLLDALTEWSLLAIVSHLVVGPSCNIKYWRQGNWITTLEVFGYMTPCHQWTNCFNKHSLIDI